MYFVAETKSSTVNYDMRSKETLKNDCGTKHFELAEAEGVEYRVVKKLEGLID